MRLLIVDDDAGLRQSLALLLGESGYGVEAEGDPERALARAVSEEFDLILCDVKMPGIDGLSFLRRYRAESGNALIIMMSAYGDEDAALAAMLMRCGPASASGRWATWWSPRAAVCAMSSSSPPGWRDTTPPC
jgi:DNA-binding response OmpR family regulator